MCHVFLSFSISPLDHAQFSRFPNALTKSARVAGRGLLNNEIRYVPVARIVTVYRPSSRQVALTKRTRMRSIRVLGLPINLPLFFCLYAN